MMSVKKYLSENINNIIAQELLVSGKSPQPSSSRQLVHRNFSGRKWEVIAHWILLRIFCNIVFTLTFFLTITIVWANVWVIFLLKSASCTTRNR